MTYAVETLLNNIVNLLRHEGHSREYIAACIARCNEATFTAHRGSREFIPGAEYADLECVLIGSIQGVYHAMKP